MVFAKIKNTANIIMLTSASFLGEVLKATEINVMKEPSDDSERQDRERYSISLSSAFVIMELEAWRY
jgi:hypothetical protein